MLDHKAEQIQFSKFLSTIKRNTKVIECLCPRKIECSGKIIKAHSIQNNKILNRISKNGLVTQIKLEEALYTQDATKIGRKIATTFSGFCNYHDNQLFKPIEAQDYKPNNKEQEFLFAYRAFAREFNIKKTSEKVYKKCIEIFPNLPYFNGMQEWAKHSLKELNKLNNLFYQSFLNENYEVIETKLVELQKEYLIAVSSVFALEYDFEGNQINQIDNKRQKLKILFLTIFPQSGKTYALISYLKEESEDFEFLEGQILNLKEDIIIKKLNLLIAHYCENFAYSPQKWEQMGKLENKEFIKTFIGTEYSIKLKEPQALAKEPKFNLFI